MKTKMKMINRSMARHTAPVLRPVAATLLLCCASAQASVGLRVLVQEWNPAQPQQQSVKQLVNEPDAVSASLLKAWREARPRVCKALSDEMGKGRAANGYTLYKIDCVLDENPEFTVTSAGANALTATLSIGGYLAATSTTPDHIDRAFDPRFSVAVKSRLMLSLSVQPNLAQTLRVDKATFALSDATLDSHGLTGDLVKFVVSDLVPFFRGPNYRQLAERAINGVGADVAARFDTALASINERLRGPSGLVRVGVWGRPDAITVAFSPRETTPPSGGTLAGVFRPDGAETISRCEGLAISATVQTGPAPLRDPGGAFDPAEAPRKKVGEFHIEPGAAPGQCLYRMTGLAAGWQNELELKSKLEQVAVATTTDRKKHYLRYSLKGDGWDGRRVKPQPSAQGNYVVTFATVAEPSLDRSIVANRTVPLQGGPHKTPGDRVGAAAATPATLNNAVIQPAIAVPAARGEVAPKSWANADAPAVRATSRVTSALDQSRSATRLNPQPLPPKAGAERAGSAFGAR